MKVLVRALSRKWLGELHLDSVSGKIVARSFWFSHGRFSHICVGSSHSAANCHRDECLNGGCAISFSEGDENFTAVKNLLTGSVRRVVLQVGGESRGLEIPKTPLERLENWLGRQELDRIREDS